MGPSRTSSASARPVVAIAFRYVHHYRREFYEQLRARLDKSGVDLRVIAGQPGPRDVDKEDAVVLPWATAIRNRYVTVGRGEICWQPFLGSVEDAELVIVEQASRLAASYVLLAWRACGGPKVGLWGHGAHIQPQHANAASEAVKREFSRRVDWWFAYNEVSTGVVRDLGFPEERITCVQNAVDTRCLSALRDSISETDLSAARHDLAIEGEHVAVFVGSLYPEKRLRFLVAAADQIRRRVPGFVLIVIGAGPEEEFAREAARTRPWIKYVGPLYGRDKVRTMMLARVALMPGTVGLGILDGFALRLPLVTTRAPNHSHEIAYLVDGENGLMADDWCEPAEFARAAQAVLTDETLRSHLQEGCTASAGRYTIEAMCDNFAGGVLRALAAPKRRWWAGR
jgi:glycosyltransferase involved in cell wall biosynthesis